MLLVPVPLVTFPGAPCPQALTHLVPCGILGRGALSALRRPAPLVPRGCHGEPPVAVDLVVFPHLLRIPFQLL